MVALLYPHGFPTNRFQHPFSIIKIDSLGCDTLESYCKLISGNNELTLKNGFTFSCFPNPANEFITLNISAPQEKVYFVQITDLQGRTLKKIELKAGLTQELNTRALPAGVYFLHLFNQGNAVEVKKLVISH